MRFGGKSQLMGLSLLAIMSVSTASELGSLAFGEGVFNKRQDSTAVSSANDEPAQSTGSPQPSTPPNDENPSTAPTPTPTPTAQPTTRPSSSQEENNDPSSQTPAPSASPSEQPSSNDGSPASSTDASNEVTTPLVSQVTTRIVFTTRSVDGTQTRDVAITTDVVSDITTGFATNTNVPGLGNDSNGGGGGLEPRAQKIIGGVVGGVGGLLLIGGIALVYLRLRKKKQTQVDMDDYPTINDYKPTSPRTSQPLNSTPFQSTLDQYHNPPTRPNAAANF